MMQDHIQSICDKALQGDTEAIKTVCVIALLKEGTGGSPANVVDLSAYREAS